MRFYPPTDHGGVIALYSSSREKTDDALPKRPHQNFDLNPVHSFYVSMEENAMKGAVPSGGASNMDELKLSVISAETGTGAVAKILQEARFQPRHNAFTSLLKMASKSRQPEKAIEIFEAMEPISNITPNIFTYSALISALAKAGRWETAEKYFNEIKEKSKDDPAMKLNTVTYAAMISGTSMYRIRIPRPPAMKSMLEDVGCKRDHKSTPLKQYFSLCTYLQHTRKDIN